MGATLQCSFGAAPATLIVVDPTVTAEGPPAANIMDHAPIVNIPTFGMCMSLANPVVAAATTAALGVLTPMPCIPATSAPWVPGSPTVTIRGMPALTQTCQCMCTWAGVITIVNAGTVKTQVG
jgi:uncharacterized Zn-binding protein involved in type VI secretion